MQIIPDLSVQIDSSPKSKFGPLSANRSIVALRSEAHDVLKFRGLYLGAESVRPNEVTEAH